MQIPFNHFFNFLKESYAVDPTVLSDLPGSELGLKNRMVFLPDNRPYGFWMDRHGNFIVVKGQQQHGKIAEQIIYKANELLPSYNQIDIDEVPSFYDFLLDAGWVRIVTTPTTVYWETAPGGRPTNIQMKNMNFMKDFYDLSSVEMG